MPSSGPKLELFLFGSACDLTAGPINEIQTAESKLPRFPCLLTCCMMQRKDMNSVQLPARVLCPAMEAEEVWLCLS